MAGYGRVVVGFRKDDRRSHQPGCRHGGSCISCSAPTYYMPSAHDAIRFRDAAIACDVCYRQYKHLMEAEL